MHGDAHRRQVFLQNVYSLAHVVARRTHHVAEAVGLIEAQSTYELLHYQRRSPSVYGEEEAYRFVVFQFVAERAAAVGVLQRCGYVDELVVERFGCLACSPLRVAGS